MHPKDCDCGRCDPPDYCKLLQEIHDLKDLKPLEYRRSVFEIKQQHEEAALRRILSTGHNVLYLRDDEPQSYSFPITPEEEVTAILFNVLNRFEEGGEYFTAQELLIASAELIHTEKQKLLPQYRLLLLVMGACVNFSDLEHVQSQYGALLKTRVFNGPAIQGARQLLNELDPAYTLWHHKVKENPDGWLFHFGDNGTATLIVSSEDHHARASPTANVEMKDMPDCDVRDIMASNDAPERRNYPKVFNARGGKYQGRVRPPYWPVALASDENGYRYLSGEVLDDILPGWRLIIDIDKKYLTHYTIKWDNLLSSLKAWRSSEKEKLRLRGIREWPAPYSGQNVGHGHPDSPSEVWHDVRDRLTRKDDIDSEGQASKVDRSSKKKTQTRSTRQGNSQRDPTTSTRYESPFPGVKGALATASGGSNRLPSGADEDGHHDLEELKSVILEEMRQGAEIINKRLDSIEKGMRGLKVRDGKERRSASPSPRTSASPRRGSVAPSGFGALASKNSARRAGSIFSEKLEPSSIFNSESARQQSEPFGNR
ncbi:uncharacterized protein N7483_007530 [Penicillium malachiteum]|uniref:uncharacterized protein n=1 Tax=Penicillium malachiteum TaxID=1324776 RepID=UPI0025487202|nr:uncharacterized protein N7483_007530 [Penicillium malachiteum]KAJ5726173.1 hypothetical protein N7483_007530 [Penicillium malachiteum]